MYELADPRAEALLIAAHRRGVAVRVLLDRAFTGGSVNQAAAARLTSAGVAVRWAPAAVIFHQKTLTVDGSTSAVLTGNLTSRYYPTTRDFVVVDHNSAAVAAIESTFADDWTADAVLPGEAVAGLVWSPGAAPSIVGLISSAHRSLTVENEEMDSGAVESALAAAARRDVDVHVIMTANRSWDAALIALSDDGVHVATYPDSASALYIHAKAIVVDATTAYLGSQNFSSSSLDRNRELGLTTTDASVVDPVVATLAGDFAGASSFPIAPSTPAPGPAPPTPAPGTTAAGCYVDPEGNCYRASEYCPTTLRGRTVMGEDGPIICSDGVGSTWRWVAAR
jgi:phosphatidylserine/phosphatidylglycerophosphate/cardiolipin synthase-like enzyme